MSATSPSTLFTLPCLIINRLTSFTVGGPASSADIVILLCPSDILYELALPQLSVDNRSISPPSAQNAPTTNAPTISRTASPSLPFPTTSLIFFFLFFRPAKGWSRRPALGAYPPAARPRALRGLALPPQTGRTPMCCQPRANMAVKSSSSHRQVKSPRAHGTGQTWPSPRAHAPRLAATRSRPHPYRRGPGPLLQHRPAPAPHFTTGLFVVAPKAHHHRYKYYGGTGAAILRVK